MVMGDGNVCEQAIEAKLSMALPKPNPCKMPPIPADHQKDVGPPNASKSMADEVNPPMTPTSNTHTLKLCDDPSTLC